MSIDYDHLYHLADIMAAERTATRPELRDDARQEAMIAAWKAHDKGKPTGLIHASMREAVVNLVRGRSMTGSKRSPGVNGVDTHQRYSAPLTRRTDEGDTLVAEPVDRASEAALRSAEDMLDLRPMLVEARQLPETERRILALRVDEDLSFAQIGRRVGLSSSAVSNRWHKRIRPKLAAHVAHVA